MEDRKEYNSPFTSKSKESCGLLPGSDIYQKSVGFNSHSAAAGEGTSRKIHLSQPHQHGNLKPDTKNDVVDGLRKMRTVEVELAEKLRIEAEIEAFQIRKGTKIPGAETNSQSTSGPDPEYYRKLCEIVEQSMTSVAPTPPMKAVAEHSVEVPQPQCICNRPPCPIVCIKCGHCFTGRVAIMCGKHTNKLHLMDFNQCPAKKCRSQSIQEYPGVDISTFVKQ